MSRKSSMFFNRELSWLEFNQRVLDEATNVDSPLLERLKFLAITASNMDEFFMVRVGGLQFLKERNSRKRCPAGFTATQQLQAVSQRAHQMVDDQYACLLDDLEPELAKAGLVRLVPDDLNEHQESVLEKSFATEVYPIFTPMAVSDPDAFPLVINRSLNICVRLAPRDEEAEPRYAVIPLGPNPQRFFRLPSESGYHYMPLEDVIRHFIDRFFPGEKVKEVVAFRITRNADMSVREDMAADLLVGMEEVLDARKQSDCVRLEVAAGVSRQTLQFLRCAIAVENADVYHCRGPLDLSAMMRMSGISGFDELRYEPWTPRRSPDVDPTLSIFEVMSQRDIMLSLPYESFEPVIRLVDEAADDPDVLAIKIILYRTSRDSPIVAALHRAAESGKSVTALIELKARFDEARNIGWAKALEQAGVQVIYGVKGLKTHAKNLIVVRREPHGIQRYVHFSTGNYNETTARLYSDISILTTNEELAADSTAFFNAVTGYSQPPQYRQLAAAPFTLRERLLELIQGEIARKKEGQKAAIMAQFNSLADPTIIEALYEASQAGVTVDLCVRGICCLKPGEPGLSENINVYSILDRYLEHSRIVYFHHGGDDVVLISSADWMPRNLDKRVELLVPVLDSTIRRRLINILKSYTRDNVKARKILPDGTYQRPKPPKKQSKHHRHQAYLYQLACEAEKQQQQKQLTMFEPHRAASPRS